ncbi:MAG TPA: hypothetical protein VIH42_09475 [Thermoguttaceae bacterium]
MSSLVRIAGKNITLILATRNLANFAPLSAWEQLNKNTFAHFVELRLQRIENIARIVGSNIVRNSRSLVLNAKTLSLEIAHTVRIAALEAKAKPSVFVNSAVDRSSIGSVLKENSVHRHASDRSKKVKATRIGRVAGLPSRSFFATAKKIGNSSKPCLSAINLRANYVVKLAGCWKWIISNLLGLY